MTASDELTPFGGRGDTTTNNVIVEKKKDVVRSIA